jgi:hypothetical protein
MVHLSSLFYFFPIPATKWDLARELSRAIGHRNQLTLLEAFPVLHERAVVLASVDT